MARKRPIEHDPVVAIFADRLRQVRRSRGMTQRELARVAHLTESYVSRLESALIAPGIDLVARIGKAIGAPISQLLEVSESPANAVPVLKEQAKRLVDDILRTADETNLLLLNQFLALLAGSIERQR